MRHTTIGMACIAVLGCTGCATAQPAETFGVGNLEAQRLTGDSIVRVPKASGNAEVTLLVTIDTEGHVVEASVAENRDKLDARPALAAASSWTFRPQRFEGKPIRAVSTIRVRYVAPEIAPAGTRFPVIDDPADVEITLQRTACLGNCPDYQVHVSGTGRIRFTSRMDRPVLDAADVHRSFNGLNVLWPGTHEAQVDPAKVAALVEQFRAAHFFGLRNAYVAGWTDQPTYLLTLRIGKTQKQVEDYVGREAGMPASVTALEDAVDALAGSSRWIAGNADTVPLLRAAGMDFGSERAARFALAVIGQASWRSEPPGAGALLQAMVTAGLDLSTELEWSRSEKETLRGPIGSAVAWYAAERGDEALFQAMDARGYVARLAPTALNHALASGAGCSAAIAKTLVARGADPKAPGANGLHALRHDYGPCEKVPIERRVAAAKMLVALGVPLEARDDLGWTPLMGCQEPEIAAVLLAAGANPNASDKDGTHALFSTNDDRVVVLMLKAHAEPSVQEKGMSLRETARISHWPATLAWLDAQKR